MALYRQLGDRHIVTFSEDSTEFIADRLRWDRDELHGQLSVSTGLLGARAMGDSDGLISFGTFNFSSPRVARDRAKELAERSRAPKLDWVGRLDEVRHFILRAERQGTPSIDLRTASKPPADDEYNIDGFRMPKRHGTIVFGDGGTAKSYHALYVAGCLAQQGVRVGLFDWELDEYAHRDRLERLFGQAMPEIRYVRCDRPLVYEVDRLKRIVADDRLDFGFCDSVGYAVPGRPEDAENAMGYFRAVRQLRIGTYHVAHVKQGDDNDQRPFGSTFWHNSARSTWYAKLAATSPDGTCKTIGLFNRKANLSSLRPAVGYQIIFDGDTTTFSCVNVADNNDLAESLPLWQRMRHALNRGPLTLARLADDLGANVDTLDRTVRRKSALFTRVPSADGISRIALVERRSA
jgi:hypothetical protein